MTSILEEIDRILRKTGETGLSARITAAAQLGLKHSDYSVYAGNLALQEMTSSPPTFSAAMEQVADSLDPSFLRTVRMHARCLNQAIVSDRDLQHDLFGIRTLQRSYLLRKEGKIMETPQYMWMRVAVGIHGPNLTEALRSYAYLSQGYFTHATPTLFNAGTRKNQCSSCFLVDMKDDSITGIFETVQECAEISKHAGGIGMTVSKIRAKGTPIQGTGGASNGLVPMLRVFDAVAQYVDQGGGKRMGSFAVYLEPWHKDVFDFLDLKKNQGAEELRARNLFYALWVPDLFMRRVQANTTWTLFCPLEAPGLDEVHGKAFDTLYERYEQRGLGKTISAQDLWKKIVGAQIETGTPYLLYKDTCNEKSNQKNLGTIKGSNLCAEIIQKSTPQETAVCNLASVALPKFVLGGASFDFQRLQEVVAHVVGNIDRIIDQNFYPTAAAKKSNLLHRPMGIGVQGLADVFQRLHIAFDSDAAKDLNKKIFETMYFAAVSASCALAEKEHYQHAVTTPFQAKGPYASYEGSPMSQGKFQFDLWGVKPSDRHDWAALRQRVAHFGVRHSLLISLMPTASTSQILGNNECIEPFTSNLYVRRVLSGNFVCVNKHLCRVLTERGLWTDRVREQLVAHRGSVQRIPEVPQDVKDVYKTVWELSQKVLIDLAADRGPYVCQSQSLNLFLATPTLSQITSMHFYGWKRGLKTGQYYLRIKPAANAAAFTVCESCSS